LQTLIIVIDNFFLNIKGKQIFRLKYMLNDEDFLYTNKSYNKSLSK